MIWADETSQRRSSARFLILRSRRVLLTFVTNREKNDTLHHNLNKSEKSEVNGRSGERRRADHPDLLIFMPECTRHRFCRSVPKPGQAFAVASNFAH